jgi:hypothetical protein
MARHIIREDIMSSRERTPDQESKEERATAVADAAPSDGKPQGFADRVGQRKPISVPDPFCIATDKGAGVRLFESRQDHQMAIMFGEGRLEDKPSQEVIGKLKDAGYRWNPADKIWARPVRAGFAMSTRIEAERLFRDVCSMVRQEKGIAAGPEIPF